MHSRFAVAKQLGKFKWEVDELPVSEYIGWLAYFQIEHRRQQQEAAAAKAKGKSGSKSMRTFGGE